MKLKLLSILAASAFVCVAAQAQDKALLETLVKKGMLSQQEAAQIAKESVAVTPGSAETKSITLKGGVQGWYEWSQQDVRTPAGNEPSQNGFTLRYVKIGLEAEVGGGWTVDIMTNFGVEGSESDYLDRVTLSKKVDYDYLKGQLDLGFRKVNFGLEQGLCDFGQLAIERSVATWFFTRPDMHGMNDAQKNFGSRAVGIFWDGIVTQLEGMYYGIAVTGGNTEAGAIDTPFGGNNNLSFYANAGYKRAFEVSGETVAFDAGLNFGYANGGYVFNGTENRSMWGINPYVTAKWRGLTVMAEYFLQQVQDGAMRAGVTAKTSTPQGINFTAAWKQDMGEWGALEPVFRWSYLTTDGMGYGTVYGAGNNALTNLEFNKAQTFYIGANWYVVPSVKFSLGYEWAQYSGLSLGGLPGDTQLTDASTVRAQIQVIF